MLLSGLDTVFKTVPTEHFSRPVQETARLQGYERGLATNESDLVDGQSRLARVATCAAAFDPYAMESRPQNATSTTYWISLSGRISPSKGTDTLSTVGRHAKRWEGGWGKIFEKAIEIGEESRIFYHRLPR